jgi:hypothetical protein
VADKLLAEERKKERKKERRRRRRIKDEVLLTVSCPIFPSILIAKNLLTGSLKK